MNGAPTAKAASLTVSQALPGSCLAQYQLQCKEENGWIHIPTLPTPPYSTHRSKQIRAGNSRGSSHCKFWFISLHRGQKTKQTKL